jgi:hypothetical protein
MYMLAGYDQVAAEYAGSSYGWLAVCHDSWDFVIK